MFGCNPLLRLRVKQDEREAELHAAGHEQQEMRRSIRNILFLLYSYVTSH